MMNAHAKLVWRKGADPTLAINQEGTLFLSHEEEDKMVRHQLVGRGILLCATAFLYWMPAHALDAKQAEDLAWSNNCSKCHDAGPDKDAPEFKKIAEKYRGDEKAEAKLVKHLTSGNPVKFPDGHEEDHKIVRTKPAEDKAQIRNLVQWVLAH